MPSFREQIDELMRLKHRLSVWETIAGYLDENFVSKDGRKAPKAIRSPGAPQEVVPEETIESVLQAIGEGPIAELTEQVNAIENQEVILSGGKKNGKSAEEETAPR